jgi:hypothetical protein
MLQIHYWFGIIILLGAIAAIISRPARRVVLYALLAQIVIGLLAWRNGGIAPPPLHWLLAVVVGGLYAFANVLERRGRPASTVTGVLVVALFLLAAVFYIGQRLHA